MKYELFGWVAGLMALVALQGCAAMKNPEVSGFAQARYDVAPPARDPASGLSMESFAEPVPSPERVAAAVPKAGSADADSPWHRYVVSLGGILVTTNSSARVGTTGAGISIDPDEALGFDSSVSSVRLAGSWRFSENRKHRVDLSWLDLSRNASKTLQQDLEIGSGVVLPAGSKVESNLDINLIRAEYAYSFYQDDRVDLAAALGLYVAPVGFDYQASGGSTSSDSFSVTAPLPVIGLRSDFLITPRWYLRGNVSLFYLEVDDFKGGIQDTTIAAEWMAFEHVAFGLGVNSFRLGVEHEGSSSIPGVNSEGSIDFSYTGLMIYVKGLF